MSDLNIICKCCVPARVYESPLLLVQCGHIVCKDKVLLLSERFNCPICNIENATTDEECDEIINLKKLIEDSYICSLHNTLINRICLTCNIPLCIRCTHPITITTKTTTVTDDNYHHIKTIDDRMIKTINHNINSYILNRKSTIHKNNNRIIEYLTQQFALLERIRVFKDYLKSKLNKSYEGTLETEFSIILRHFSKLDIILNNNQDSIAYIQRINEIIDQTTTNGVGKSLINTQQWFKTKNKVYDQSKYTIAISENGSIDQVFKNYYSEQTSNGLSNFLCVIDAATNYTITRFRQLLAKCLNLQESTEVHPYLCYPVLYSHRFFSKPQHPIVDPINNNNLDLFIKDTKNKDIQSSSNSNSNNNNSKPNIFIIYVESIDSDLTRLFAYLWDTKFPFNYMFYISSLEDYKNILNNNNVSYNNNSNILIEVFNRFISRLESVLLIYHPKFYNQYKDDIPYNCNNTKVIIVTTHSHFKKNEKFNIFGELYLQELNIDNSELLFRQIIGKSFIKDEYMIKPLIRALVGDTKQITSAAYDVIGKKISLNSILYNHISINYLDSRSISTILSETLVKGLNDSKIEFKFYYGNQFLIQLLIDNSIVPSHGQLSIQNSKGEKTFWSHSVSINGNKQLGININAKDKEPYHLYVNSQDIELDLTFEITTKNIISFSSNRLNEFCISGLQVKGTVRSKSLTIDQYKDFYGSISVQPISRPTGSHKLFEIDACEYTFDSRISLRLEYKNISSTTNTITTTTSQEIIKNNNFINVDGIIHYIGDVGFNQDFYSDTLIINSKFSRFNGEDKHLIFKSKNNQTMDKTKNTTYFGNLSGEILLKDGEVLQINIPANIIFNK